MRSPEQQSTIYKTSYDKPKKRRFSRLKVTRSVLKKIVTVVIGIACVGVLIYLYTAWRQSIPTPLPSGVISSLNYQVYYPSRIPSGYSYKEGSATSHNGLLFFKFTSGKKIIIVTEQAAPPKSLDILKITGGYTALKVPIGKAGVGSSVGNPSVIIITDSTLINITSGKGVTKEQVTNLAQKMKLVEPADSL